MKTKTYIGDKDVPLPNLYESISSVCTTVRRLNPTGQTDVNKTSEYIHTMDTSQDDEEQTGDELREELILTSEQNQISAHKIEVRENYPEDVQLTEQQGEEIALLTGELNSGVSKCYNSLRVEQQEDHNASEPEEMDTVATVDKQVARFADDLKSVEEMSIYTDNSSCDANIQIKETDQEDEYLQRTINTESSKQNTTFQIMHEVTTCVCTCDGHFEEKEPMTRDTLPVGLQVRRHSSTGNDRNSSTGNDRLSTRSRNHVSLVSKYVLAFCLVAAFLNPLLAPLVVIFVYRSKYNMARRVYAQADTDGYTAVGLALTGVIVTITGLLILSAYYGFIGNNGVRGNSYDLKSKDVIINKPNRLRINNTMETSDIAQAYFLKHDDSLASPEKQAHSTTTTTGHISNVLGAVPRNGDVVRQILNATHIKFTYTKTGTVKIVDIYKELLAADLRGNNDNEWNVS